MGQFSETMGSFIRTGNYPLEANYVFNSEQELKDFYADELNNTLLHKGLFKVVSTEEKQTLYWVVNVNDELVLTPLISTDTIEQLEEKINNVQPGDIDLTDYYTKSEIDDMFNNSWEEYD